MCQFLDHIAFNITVQFNKTLACPKLGPAQPQLILLYLKILKTQRSGGVKYHEARIIIARRKEQRK